MNDDNIIFVMKKAYGDDEVALFNRRNDDSGLKKKVYETYIRLGRPPSWTTWFAWYPDDRGSCYEVRAFDDEHFELEAMMRRIGKSIESCIVGKASSKV